MTDETTTSGRTRVVVIAAVSLFGVLLLVLAANLLAGVVGGGTSLPPGQPVEITVQPGSPASTVYRDLADAGVVSYSSIENAVDDADAETLIQPGTYALETGMDADAVLAVLLEGGTVTDSRAITIVEGWTVDRIITALAEATEFEESDFIAALEAGAVTSPFLPVATDSLTIENRWEGLLYPARYEIPVGATAASILQQMADTMVARYEQVDWSMLDDTGFDRYEILTMASLIEREAGTEEDRALISSVLHNRLAMPMRLQIDATVIYALGENPGRVLADDLEIDSPYNTYRVDGLPPTPIGTVSIPSIEAALSPAETDYLFYVLTDTDGSHAFAVTYEEHQVNVEDAKARGVLP